MHFKSLLHVRDHSKAKGRAHHLLEYIAQHVNRHTGEAFDLSVERLADRLDVTPQWVRQLRTRLSEARQGADGCFSPGSLPPGAACSISA